MKKKILVTVLCLTCLIVLTACSENNKECSENNKKTSTIFSSEYVNLEIIEDTKDGKVLMDKDTGVLYLLYINHIDGTRSQTLTPLYNADGSLKNIVDFE